jgi:CRP/FNR family transcriptional regulator
VEAVGAVGNLVVVDLMNIDSHFLVIRNHALFKQLTAKECHQLNIIGGLIQAEKNDYIYFDKYSLDRLYFLKKGYVKIGYYDDQGNEVIREVLKEGDVFGQVGLETYNHQGEFAKAIKESAVICSFTIQDFESILQKRPDLAISFTKLVGLKFKRLQNRLSNIVFKDVKVRLLEFFISLIEQHQLGQPETVEISNYLTHADVASLIGATRQTVTTLINQLEYDKVLFFDRKKIFVPDVAKLKSYHFS